MVRKSARAESSLVDVSQDVVLEVRVGRVAGSGGAGEVLALSDAHHCPEANLPVHHLLEGS